MLAHLLRKLDTQMPWLGTALGNRLELEIPAYMVSLSMHALFLVLLGLVGHRVHQVVQPEFPSRVLDSALSSTESTFQDLDQGADTLSITPAAGSFAPNLAMTITSIPSSADAISATPNATKVESSVSPELAGLEIRQATEIVLPTASIMGQTVSIKGNGAEHVGGVEGAVDRIAVEILRRLEARANPGHLGI